MSKPKTLLILTGDPLKALALTEDQKQKIVDGLAAARKDISAAVNKMTRACMNVNMTVVELNAQLREHCDPIISRQSKGWRRHIRRQKAALRRRDL